MHVESDNVGTPREVEWEGRTVLSDIFKSPVAANEGDMSHLVEERSIEHVNRGPSVEPLADVSRDALFASDGDRAGGEALLDRVMDLRQAHFHDIIRRAVD